MSLEKKRSREAAGVLPEARDSTGMLVVKIRYILPFSKVEERKKENLYRYRGYHVRKKIHCRSFSSVSNGSPVLFPGGVLACGPEPGIAAAYRASTAISQ